MSEMPTYQVALTVTVSLNVVVEAEDEEAAARKATLTWGEHINDVDQEDGVVDDVQELAAH